MGNKIREIVPSILDFARPRGQSKERWAPVVLAKLQEILPNLRSEVLDVSVNTQFAPSVELRMHVLTGYPCSLWA